MRDCANLREALAADLNVQEHMLTSDMSLEAANKLWLLNSFWKKFQDEIGPDADASCLKLFKESNERCRNFVLKPQSVQDEEVIGEVKSLWIDFLGNGVESHLKLSDILDNIGVGPGANVGARSYDFYVKLFDSPLTGTSEQLYRLYRYAIQANPTWYRAEVAREQRYGHRMVQGNRLSYVPKTSEVSRSICTEPTLNMLVQKGIGFSLEKMLKRMFRIDLSVQPNLNKRMARIGSIDGSFGTIDLSSASDSISLQMLQQVIPEELLNWLILARSPNVIYPDGTAEELYMVSSMGNGFTFPLETLLFSSIVVACYRVLGIKPKYDRNGPLNWAVFGDDIIVRKDSYDFVIRALKLFGFTPNDQKSFNSGDFRESCGGDYYRGFDIRGVYVRSLKTSADIYSTVNRLLRWCARTGVFLPRTLSLLKGMVKELPIPLCDGDAEGIKVPYPPTDMKRRSDGAYCYFALVRMPKSYRMPLTPEEQRWFRLHQRRREITYNANGILVALVGGFVRNGRVIVRDDVNMVKIRRRVIYHWPNTEIRSDLRNRVTHLAQYQGLGGYVTLPVDRNDLGYEWVFMSELYSQLESSPRRTDST
jgi:hypothetical protein